MAMPDEIRDREYGKFEDDASGNPAVRTVSKDSEYTEMYAYNADGMVEYVGRAAPGTDEAAASWQIFKLTYSGTNATEKKWASGSAAFGYSWSLRATYVYS